MSIEIIKGNLFNSNCQTLVNTVNCVGAMGKGIALDFRLRYPLMYERYLELCKYGYMEIGKLWIYKANKHWVLNFPTKKDWKNPSKIEYLELGLQKFVNTYQQKGITSIAFPLLGSQNGGILTETSLSIMEKYLGKLNIKIEIYFYNPYEFDDIFAKVKTYLFFYSQEELLKITGLRLQYLERIKNAILKDEIVNLSQLVSIKGIGLSTIQKFLLILPMDSF
jgi:O-acetyl-ADP-ribose deacetylase (regulator of RNase III)